MPWRKPQLRKLAIGVLELRSRALFDLSTRPGPSVGCGRDVTAVYGFDGPETDRLRSLELAFPVAGWEIGRRDVTGSWADIDDAALAGPPDTLPRHRGWMAYRDAILRWRPSAVIGHPSYGEGSPPWGDDRPPFVPYMRVSWQRAGQEITVTRDTNRTSSVTRNSLPLENSDAQHPELLEEALRRHEYAMSVTMDLSYYVNALPRSRPHRVRRYILPTR